MFDTLDDRREIHQLLRRLSPLKRVEFMRWFLAHQKLGPWKLMAELNPETVKMARRAMNDDALDERHAYETYVDIWNVSSSYESEGLTLDLAFNRLVELVKGKSQ